MRGAGLAVIAPARHGPRYPTLAGEPPIAWRPTPDGLYLAASAAAPLGGDETCLEVRVLAGAHARIRTVGATVALPGCTPVASRTCWHIAVAAGAQLIFMPEPTVVATGAWHRSEIDVALAPGARLVLREQVVLGRHGEAGGRWQGRLAVRRGDTELVVQEHDVDGSSVVDRGPYGTGGATAFGSYLEIGCGAGGSLTGPGWARMPLAAGTGVLGVAVAADAVGLYDRLARAAQDPR